jgi:hypothetical protein
MTEDREARARKAARYYSGMIAKVAPAGTPITPEIVQADARAREALDRWEETGEGLKDAQGAAEALVGAWERAASPAPEPTPEPEVLDLFA